MVLDFAPLIGLIAFQQVLNTTLFVIKAGPIRLLNRVIHTFENTRQLPLYLLNIKITTS
jgi:hypothetical protein